MAMEIDEAVIRVDNHAEIDEVEPIEISDDEARRVRLYENFYQVNAIDPALYAQHDVKRGLRNADGTGVLAGMTNISNVHGYVMSDGEKMPAEGSLRLRGYDLYDLLGDLDPTRRFAFEEVAYLLLMGELPTQERLNRFVEVIDSQRELPDGFTASTLMVDTSPDLMNMMARSILRLYAADESAEDSTWVVNDELLPPPCSACRHSMMSSMRASSGANERSGRSMERMVSAVDCPGTKRCMIMDSWLKAACLA